MRQCGSAVGSWGDAQVCTSLAGFWVAFWFVLASAATTEAHVGHVLATIGVAWVFGSCTCSCTAWVGFCSSSLSFLVRYALVSARNAIVGSAGFLVSSSSAISSMLLSQSLKKPIFFQDCIFFLFLSSWAMVHISFSRFLTMASSISSSCLCWSLRYSLYALSISSWDICSSPSLKYISSISGLSVVSGAWGSSSGVFSAGGGGMPSPFMAISAGLNQSPSVLRPFVLCGALAGIWLVWSSTSNLYLSLLFGLSLAGVVVPLLAFLLLVQPAFCCFLGSAILA